MEAMMTREQASEVLANGYRAGSYFLLFGIAVRLGVPWPLMAVAIGALSVGLMGFYFGGRR